MDRATEYGEPIAYDAADKMEANGITPLEAGRKLIAVGLSRVRAAIDDKLELAEELNWLSSMLAEEAEAVLKNAVTDGEPTPRRCEVPSDPAMARPHPAATAPHGALMPCCKEKGLTTVADQVDHIVVPNGNGTLQRDPSNHQSLCASCHSIKTNGQGRGWTNEMDADGYPLSPLHPSNR